MAKKTKMAGKVESALKIGAGVAAVSAAAYLLFGPDKNRNRNKIKGWAVKMKGEIIEKFEQAKEITEPVYKSIIEEVSDKYSKLKDVKPEELSVFVNDLQKYWKSILKTSKPNSKKKVSKSKKTK